MGDKTITRTQSFALSVPNSDFSYLSSILLNRFKRQEEDDYESSGEGMCVNKVIKTGTIFQL